jgi:hypothetical protein
MLQPVLEFSKRHEHSYTYAIHASRKSVMLPEACYVDRGLPSLAACVSDAAQALSVNFPRVYLRYQGVGMGEVEVGRLGMCAEAVAQELMTEYQRRGLPQGAIAEAARRAGPLQASAHRSAEHEATPMSAALDPARRTDRP